MAFNSMAGDKGVTTNPAKPKVGMKRQPGKGMHANFPGTTPGVSQGWAGKLVGALGLSRPPGDPVTPQLGMGGGMRPGMMGALQGR
jgi:hypothetical protein